MQLGVKNTRKTDGKQHKQTIDQFDGHNKRLTIWKR